MEAETPLHPWAIHEHSTIGSTSFSGIDAKGRHYKVRICKCGTPFFYEPD